MRSRLLSKITPDGKYEVAEEVPDNGNIAWMVKSGCAPAIHGGDTYFFAGKGTLAKQFEGAENQLDFIVAAAKKNGYNPNPNDVYMGSMAQFPGDPAAFVPPSGGVNHIKHVAEARDLSCEGAYTRKRTIKEPDETPRMDRKIYRRIRKEMIAADPALGRKSTKAIKEAVYEKHAYKPGVM